MLTATVCNPISFDVKKMNSEIHLDFESFNSEKYFISYQDKSKKRFLVAIENGSFFGLENGEVKNISFDEIVRTVILIKNKIYKLNGHGHYSKSILN